MVLVQETHTLLAEHVWVTWVAGLSYHSYEAQAPAVSPGHPLLLRPEPANPFDVHALAVCGADGSDQIGYIPHAYAVKLRPEHRFGLALMEQMEDGKRTGLLIAVSRDPIDLRHVTLEPKFLGRRLAHLPKVQIPQPSSAGADPVEEMWETWRALHPAEAVP